TDQDAACTCTALPSDHLPERNHALDTEPGAPSALRSAQVTPSAEKSLPDIASDEQNGEPDLPTARHTSEGAARQLLVVELPFTRTYCPNSSQSARRCVHDACPLDAEWREMHFALRWQDGSETAIATVIPLCERHFAELRARRHIAPAAGRDSEAKHAA